MLAGLILEDHLDGLVEDFLESLLGEGAALDVFAVHLFLDDLAGGFASDGGLLGVRALPLVLLAQVDLVAHEYLGGGGNAILQFGKPLRRSRSYLFLGVEEGRRVNDREADDEHIAVGVGEGAQAVVLLLAGGVPT